MQKRDITLDMFLVLKEEIDTNLLEIINGTYIYQGKFNYLNRVPRKEREIIFEKIMHIANKRKYQDDENPLDYLDEFITNFKKMTKSELKRSHLINLKYDLMLHKSKKKGVAKKVCTSIIFVSILAFNISLKTMGSDKEDTLEYLSSYNDESIDTQIDIPLEKKVHSDIAMAKEWEEEKKEEDVVEEATSSDIEREKQIQNILIEQNLTKEQFNTICAIVSAEAKYGSYTDAYWVINTIYNRVNSKTWVEYASQFYSIENAGLNLYYQAILNGQFVTYENGRYKEFLNDENDWGYQAVIDFLDTKEVVHNYLSFRSANTELDNYVQATDGGNKYFNSLQNEDRLNPDKLTK